jgi:hypothetical protein
MTHRQRDGRMDGDVEVYTTRPVALTARQPHGAPGCTNGPSGNVGGLIILATEDVAAIYRDRPDADPGVWMVLVVRSLFGHPDVIVEPLRPCDRERIGYMAGGNTVDLSVVPDVAYTLTHGYGVDPSELTAVRVHDRSETPAQYAALSQ